MSTLTLNDGIQLRGGTAEALSTVNPIPKAREIIKYAVIPLALAMGI